MDKLNKLILSYLIKDPQMSFGKIAKKLGKSPYTIRNRYKKMKKKGIIPYRVVGIDLSKIGYQGRVSLFVTLSPNRDKSVIIPKILKIRNIYSAIELVGPCNIVAQAAIENLNSIMNIICKIKKLPDVQRVDIAISNDTRFPISANYGEILSKKILKEATI